MTLDQASELGYRGLTIEAIARRAGVGKHTIYRRWSSLSELLFDALSHVWSSELDYRTTGRIRDDLREQFIRSSSTLSSPPLGPIYRAVIADAQSDPGLRKTFHEWFLSTVEQSTTERIRQAQSQGELKDGADAEGVIEVLVGSLYYRWLLSDRPVGEDIIDALIGMFMRAYGVPEEGAEDHGGER